MLVPYFAAEPPAGIHSGFAAAPKLADGSERDDYVSVTTGNDRTAGCRVMG